VFVKMGTVEYASRWPPSTDRHPRFTDRNLWATIVTAGVFAHAARVYRVQFAPWRALSAEWRASRARPGHGSLTHPRSYDCDSRRDRSLAARIWTPAEQIARSVFSACILGADWKGAYHEAFKKRVGADAAADG